MATMLQELASRLRAGEPFSEAIAALHESFPSYYPGIVRSAELSGHLDVVLEQLASYIDRDLQTRGKVKSALMYPMVLLCMTLVTVVILVGFVLPEVQGLLQGLRRQAAVHHAVAPRHRRLVHELLVAPVWPSAGSSPRSSCRSVARPPDDTHGTESCCGRRCSATWCAHPSSSASVGSWRRWCRPVSRSPTRWGRRSTAPTTKCS